MKRKKILLSSTRVASGRGSKALSSKATRAVISKHHHLQKNLSLAKHEGDILKIKTTESEIEARGGLKEYQKASTLGQSLDRGGDTSKVLVKWITSMIPPETSRPLKLLEVGALRVDNACSRSKLFEVERIDLLSQHGEIKQQDFMKRPLPPDTDAGEERFDVVSLSLVLNFVSDATERGNMLRHAGNFLKQKVGDQTASTHGEISGLFLVLPAPCIKNSRYLTEHHLESIMDSLGFALLRKRMSQKLYFSYWHYSKGQRSSIKYFSKKELRGGAIRNNFAIVIGERQFEAM